MFTPPAWALAILDSPSTPMRLSPTSRNPYSDSPGKSVKHTRACGCAARRPVMEPPRPVGEPISLWFA